MLGSLMELFVGDGPWDCHETDFAREGDTPASHCISTDWPGFLRTGDGDLDIEMGLTLISWWRIALFSSLAWIWWNLSILVGWRYFHTKYILHMHCRIYIQCAEYYFARSKICWLDESWYKILRPRTDSLRLCTVSLMTGLLRIPLQEEKPPNFNICSPQTGW